MRTTTEANGIRTVEEVCPDGWVVVDVYDPCSSVTPWDSYGRGHQREYGKVLKSAGIEFVPLRTSRTILQPMGSGSGGAVRFGDNMTPGTYQIAVPKGDETKARKAIAEHRALVNAS